MTKPLRPAGPPNDNVSALQNAIHRQHLAAAGLSEQVSAQMKNSAANQTASAARETARETRRTADAMQVILDGQKAAEDREGRMLKWTVVAASCAVVAALAGVASLIVAIIALYRAA